MIDVYVEFLYDFQPSFALLFCKPNTYYKAVCTVEKQVVHYNV